MVDNLGFFTSRYKDPNTSVGCLGGEVYSMIVKDTIGEIFSPINEYYSTNTYIDYRVIYIKNIARKQGVIISSPSISVDHIYLKKQEIFRVQDLYRVRVNLFAPISYAGVNYMHPKIFTNGEFIQENKFIGDFTIENTNPRYYGRSILLDSVSLKTNEYYPVVLERVIKGPVPFIKNFSFKLTAKYTVTLE